jgi:hypothetical protein
MVAWQSFTALAETCAGRFDEDEAVAWAAESLRRETGLNPSLHIAAASTAVSGHLNKAKGFMEL